VEAKRFQYSIVVSEKTALLMGVEGAKRNMSRRMLTAHLIEFLAAQPPAGLAAWITGATRLAEEKKGKSK